MRKYLVVGLMVALAVAAYAQPSINEGTKELMLEGAWDPEGTAGAELDLTLGYGVFMRDKLEVGGLLEYASYEDAGGPGVDVKGWGLGGFVEYNFDMASMSVPYVGARVAYQNIEAGGLDDSAFTYGPRVGLKYYIADNVAIDFGLNYTLASEEVFINEGEVDDTDLSVDFGIRATF